MAAQSIDLVEFRMAGTAPVRSDIGLSRWHMETPFGSLPTREFLDGHSHGIPLNAAGLAYLQRGGQWFGMVSSFDRQNVAPPEDHLGYDGLGSLVALTNTRLVLSYSYR